MNNKKVAEVLVDTLVAVSVKNMHKQLFQFHLRTEGKTK